MLFKGQADPAPLASSEDFVAERKKSFMRHTAARKLAPFHVDKHRYDELAWAEVDAYLDWLDLDTL